MKNDPVLILQPGREKSLLRRHPWIFSGAVDRVEGDPAPGATVEVRSSSGEFLARAAYSPASQIRARAWTFDPAEAGGRGLLPPSPPGCHQSARTLLRHANFALSAFRLVYAESDGLPGTHRRPLRRHPGAQFLSAGADYWRDTIVNLLVELTGLEQVYERSDADVRQLEGLPVRIGPLHGNPRETLTIAEEGLQFRVDLAGGHKTGFYLDQHLNRQAVRFLARDRDVLDCFCYTGGFSVNALAGGAGSVLSVDSSADALALCRENVTLNALPAERHSVIEGDVFQLLRKFRDENRSFDLIVLDPPKFAPTAAQAEKAARGYKDINLLAFKLLRPGGYLVTFSCSGGVDAALFQKIVASAALDAGVDARILEHLEQSPDHPVALHFPEGTYLKGLLCRKT